MSKVRVQTVQAKSILTTSRLPEADLVLNPFIGCSHSCTYCYATFMRRFTGHVHETWGEFVDVKEFDVKSLRRKLQHVQPGTTVFLGSVTDAYQAFERRFRVTAREWRRS